jgi:Holliday junction resolvasome RuvABC endonuclease subunit
MDTNTPKYPRVLAIAPSTNGFGFAVFEGQGTLADWDAKKLKRDKNNGTVARVEGLIARYQPQVIVMEDASAKDSRRRPRIRKLVQRISALAVKRGIKVALFSRNQVLQYFFADGNGTKHEIAEIIARQFPEELGFQLPPERRAWDSEDHRMDIFDAVALLLALRGRA